MKNVRYASTAAAVVATAALLASYACQAQPASSPAAPQGRRPAPAAPASAQPAGQQAPQAAAMQPAQIDRTAVIILVRSVMLALQHANDTGNYTVLRDIGAPGFQAANTASRLSEIFANLRSQRIDLSALSVLDPQLANVPQIDQAGMMLIEGLFPTTPAQVNFKLLFAPVDNRWRLFGISINLVPPPGSTAPAEPSQRPQAAPPNAAQPPSGAARPAAPPAARPPASSPPPAATPPATRP